jgi:hypothetical protein
MLFNRLLSLVALLSVAGHVLTAPIPKLDEIEVKPPCGEVELERESDGTLEAEFEPKCVVHGEVELKATDPTVGSSVGDLVRRQVDSNLSLAGSVLAAQQQLDVLKPQIGQIPYCL